MVLQTDCLLYGRCVHVRVRSALPEPGFSWLLSRIISLLDGYGTQVCVCLCAGGVQGFCVGVAVFGGG